MLLSEGHYQTGFSLEYILLLQRSGFPSGSSQGQLSTALSYPGPRAKKEKSDLGLLRLLPNTGPNRARAGQRRSQAAEAQAAGRPKLRPPSQAGQVAPPRLPGWLRIGFMELVLLQHPE